MADVEPSVTASARPRKRAPRAHTPDTPDAIEIAMSAARGSDQALAVLRKHAGLIDAQEVLTRADLSHRQWQIVGERVGAILKGLTALAGLIFLIAAGWFVWSASRADGIVVEAFSVPAEMEARGLSGAVVAAQLLDKINTIEAGTQSARAPSSYGSSWGEDSAVEVPYAGVSLGELRRELREWLGSETRLSGEVVRLDADRIAISFRTGPRASGRVEGSAAELDALMDQAALAMFRATQPYRYAIWLDRNRPDSPEKVEILERLSRSADIDERAWGLHGLALEAATDAESVAIYRRALRLRPDFLPALGNLPGYALNAGREQEAQLLSERAATAFRVGQPDYNPGHAAGYGKDAAAVAADLKGDRLGAARWRSGAVEDSADVVNSALRPFTAALAWSRVHDLAAAQAALAAAGYLDPARRAAGEAIVGPQPSPALLRAIATDDFAAAVPDYRILLDRQTALAADPGLSAADRNSIQLTTIQLRIDLGEALARSERAAEAIPIVANLPIEHDAAMRARALVAAALGRTAESEALFARAVARAPLLPLAHCYWAEARLRRGDLAGAIEQARLAHEKGPRWAEPLRLWGLALSRQRAWAEAARRFGEAAERAPRWGALQLDWAQALWATGARGEARARLQAAAAMELSAADRARLARMIAAARGG